MDRRTFIKALVSLGAVTKVAVIGAYESSADFPEGLADVYNHWLLFEVDDSGTLSCAKWKDPTTRAEAYDLTVDDIRRGDIESLYGLQCDITAAYQDYLECYEDLGDNAWRDWFDSKRAEDIDAVDSVIEDWLQEEPDWGNEWESIYTTGTAQGAAYQFFLYETPETLEALGVTIIEGEHPGSSYYAAELTQAPSEANAAAAAAGIDIRFIRGADVARLEGDEA